MKTIADDVNRSIVLFVNDYNIEFELATKKLSEKLGRPLRGIILVDVDLHAKNMHKAITSTSVFEEVVCDYSNPASITRALKPFHDKLLAVNASSERNQPYYRKLIPHLSGIMTPTESSILWATQKDLMRKLLHSYSPSISPTTKLITSKNLDDTLREYENANYPLITKPAGLAASILVKRADSYAELRANINDSFSEINQVYRKFRGRGEPKLLIEEFMNGDMYSVDAYVDNTGKTWILPPVKVVTAASIGLEGYYSYSILSEHGLSQDQIEALNLVAAQSIHALGLRNSVAHIELFDTPSGWKIIELGPRAGGYRQDMYLLSYDIDHALNELLVKCGHHPTVYSPKMNSSAVLNIYADTEGVIKEINGFEEATSLKGIHRLTLHAKPGDKAIFCGNGGSFIVDGVVYGESEEQTNELMGRIRQMIHIVTE